MRFGDLDDADSDDEDHDDVVDDDSARGSPRKATHWKRMPQMYERMLNIQKDIQLPKSDRRCIARVTVTLALALQLPDLCADCAGDTRWARLDPFPCQRIWHM